VRFFFATNKDLEIEVEDMRFRRDLFYRINVFKVEVPPLRERVNDIPQLAQFFLEKYNKELNKKIEGFTPEAMQRLREYFWPGNVRELQNVIERAFVLAKGKLITEKDIGFEKVKMPEVMPLKDIKREAIIESLNASHWNVTKAAKLLGIGRRSMHRYIKKYNIMSDSTMSINPKKSES
ncbi:MAG: sigma-54-dependent Fis family transcriptional regulator, partial [candidate division WOR-3 bacterium]